MISNFCIANNISHKLLTINQLLASYIISYYTLPSVKTTDSGGVKIPPFETNSLPCLYLVVIFPTLEIIIMIKRDKC